MIEIFTVESANSSNYYEIGHEFENSFGKEADHHQYQHYDRLCSLEHCQSTLRNLMLQENYALKNMNDTVVQECLNKNDHSGAMNYLLHLQFNKLSNRIPYMAGSSNQLNKGRNMIHNLISVTQIQHSIVLNSLIISQCSPSSKKHTLVSCTLLI